MEEHSPYMGIFWAMTLAFIAMILFAWLSIELIDYFHDLPRLDDEVGSK